MRVEIIDKAERPNLLAYCAMKTDYGETNVYDQLPVIKKISEEELGKRVMKNCIKHNHWGVLEHSHITFNIIGFPHSVITQARTHRVGNSFDVQSMRYTGKRFLNYLENYTKEELLESKLENLFAYREVGNYRDREGKNYFWTEQDIKEQKTYNIYCMEQYTRLVKEKGLAYEHARDWIPYNFIQDYMVTYNSRSLLHVLDLRLPKDAQLEIRLMCEMMFEKFSSWMPELAEWYKKNRYGRNRLAP